MFCMKVKVVVNTSLFSYDIQAFSTCKTGEICHKCTRSFACWNIFRFGVLPHNWFVSCFVTATATSSALSAVCDTQANCNPVHQFRPASKLLNILLQNLPLLWNTTGVNTNIFSHTSHTQHIRRDKRGEVFWLIKPSSNLHRREISTFTR